MNSSQINRTKRLSLGTLLLLGLMTLISLTGCSENGFSLEQKPEFKQKFKPYLGSWQGQIETGPAQTAPIILHFTNRGDNIMASIDSPQQDVFDLPLDIKHNNLDTLYLTNDQLDLLYTAKLNKNAIAGELAVQRHRFTLNLIKQSAQHAKSLAQAMDKPQTPNAPFPYTVETHKIHLGSHHIGATLTYPKGHGPFPAVVLISGSGPDNRDYEKYGHKRFLVLADFLTRHGIAVLRYDERGIGESSGDYRSANFDDFVYDVNGMVNFLSKHSAINTKKIGVIGHSEGGMISALAANNNKKIAFTVLLATLTDDDIGLNLQYENIARTMNIKPNEFVSAVNELEQLTISGASAAQLIEHYMANHQQTQPLPSGFLHQSAAHLTSPVMRSFLAYNAKHTLSQLKTPTLSICGQRDHYFDCDKHTQSLNKIAKANPELALTQRVYPNLNHYLQTATSGTIAEEANLTETISPTVLKDISQWILQRN